MYVLVSNVKFHGIVLKGIENFDCKSHFKNPPRWNTPF